MESASQISVLSSSKLPVSVNYKLIWHCTVVRRLVVDVAFPLYVESGGRVAGKISSGSWTDEFRGVDCWCCSAAYPSFFKTFLLISRRSRCAVIGRFRSASLNDGTIKRSDAIRRGWRRASYVAGWNRRVFGRILLLDAHLGVISIQIWRWRKQMAYAWPEPRRAFLTVGFQMPTSYHIS